MFFAPTRPSTQEVSVGNDRIPNGQLTDLWPTPSTAREILYGENAFAVSSTKKHAVPVVSEDFTAVNRFYEKLNH